MARTKYPTPAAELTAAAAQATLASENLLSETAQANKGGRPPAPHGQVIGAVTLKIASLAADQLGRSTTDSVAAELQVEYAKLGAIVNAQSLKKWDAVMCKAALDNAD